MTLSDSPKLTNWVLQRFEMSITCCLHKHLGYGSDVGSLERVSAREIGYGLAAATVDTHISDKGVYSDGQLYNCISYLNLAITMVPYIDEIIRLFPP